MSLEEEVRLQRTSSKRSSSRKILPSTPMTASAPTSSTVDQSNDTHEKPFIRRFSMLPLSKPRKPANVPTILRSILSLLPIPALIFPTCRWLSIPSSSPSLGRRVTGTLFGPKKGHVTFAVQEDPRSEPVLLLELATPTCNLVKEMASGLVRIALECERGPSSGRGGVKLFNEPMWTMYCNGRKSGYAVSRTCGESDCHVLRTVQTVSIGAGVLPAEKGAASAEGELMYMRARFERVVGNRDSEAFYMLNPDGNGGPELSIFLLRI